jgi:hypothetical protein
VSQSISGETIDLNTAAPWEAAGERRRRPPVASPKIGRSASGRRGRFSGRRSTATWRVSCAAIALLVASTAAAQEGSPSKTKITVTYDEVDTPAEAGKLPFRAHRVREYILSGSKSLSVLAPDMSGGAAGLHALGDVGYAQTNDSRSYKVSYSVIAGALVIVTEFDGFSTVRKIYTDGKTSCRSTLDYIKDKGEENFVIKWPQRTIVYKDMRAENITCSIVTASD